LPLFFASDFSKPESDDSIVHQKNHYCPLRSSAKPSFLIYGDACFFLFLMRCSSKRRPDARAEDHFFHHMTLVLMGVVSAPCIIRMLISSIPQYLVTLLSRSLCVIPETSSPRDYSSAVVVLRYLGARGSIRLLLCPFIADEFMIPSGQVGVPADPNNQHPPGPFHIMIKPLVNS